jgi:predicted ABC-type ATPase
MHVTFKQALVKYRPDQARAARGRFTRALLREMHVVSKGYPEYDPGQPRDERGRFSSGGGVGSRSEGAKMLEYRSSWRDDPDRKPSVYDPDYFSLELDTLRNEAGDVIAERSKLVPRRAISDYDIIASGPDIIHRGMSHDEYQEFLRTGVIRSKGTHNIGDAQKGLTYYTTEPASAVSYASSFAPAQFKPAPGRDAYVVSIRLPSADRIVNVPGTASHEVGVTGPVPASDVVAVYRGRVIAYTPEYNGPGFKSAASSWLHWEKLADNRGGAHKRMWKGYPEYRPDQPRGNDGRWGGGGGTGALRRGREARDLLARNLKAKPTPSLSKFMAGLTAEQRSYIRKTLRMLKGKRSTAEQFKNADGTWMKSRRRLHDRIINTRLRDAMQRAKPASGEKPKLVIMGGRPGSGKTTSLMHSGFVPDMERYLYVNADDLRGDNKKWLRDGNKDYGLPGYAGWNSTLYHEEASMLVDRLERAGRDLGLNVIHDATLRSPEASIALMDEYQSKGYEVSGLFVHATPENATMRAIGRAMKSPTGRFVPTYILGKYVNEAAFDVIKDRMDQWKLYDANGRQAKLVAAKRGRR